MGDDEITAERLAEVLESVTEFFSLQLDDPHSTARDVFRVDSDQASACFSVGNVYDVHVHVEIGVEGGHVSVCSPGTDKSAIPTALCLITDLRTACEMAAQVSVILQAALQGVTTDSMADALRQNSQQMTPTEDQPN